MMARDQLERALGIDLVAYGDKHPDVARDYSALASVMRDLQAPSTAQEYEEKAIQVRRNVAEMTAETPALASIES